MVLPRTTTFYALESVRTGLTRIGCTGGPVESGGSLKLVHSLAVHPALASMVGGDAREVLAPCQVEGPWYDIQGEYVGEPGCFFTEAAYIDLVDAHAGKLVPVVPADDPGRWQADMEAHLTAAETWLLDGGPTRTFVHDSTGITRFTFRPGRRMQLRGERTPARPTRPMVGTERCLPRWVRRTSAMARRRCTLAVAPPRATARSPPGRRPRPRPAARPLMGQGHGQPQHAQREPGRNG